MTEVTTPDQGWGSWVRFWPISDIDPNGHSFCLMRNLLRPDGAARGAAAFFAALLLAALLLLVALSVFASNYGGWDWRTAFAWALILFVSLAAAAPMVLVFTLLLRATGLPRPVADIVTWSLTFVGLWLLLWGPTLNAFLDGLPLTASSLLISCSIGGLTGWVYWLCAGRPRPASDR